jgi:hypothetical protein
VIAVDAQGRQVYRQLIADPRVLRAERPGPTGELVGETLHHATADFSVALPDDPSIVELHFYQPRWTGTGWTLDPIGRVGLP